MTFTFDFELSEAQQVRASRWITLRQRESRAALAFFGLVGFMSVVHVALVLAGRSSLAWWTVAGLALAPGGWYLLAYWSPQAQVRTLREKNRAAGGSHSHVLSEAGLNTAGLGVTASVEWANVVKAVETKEFFLFFLSTQFAQVLPKAAVTSAQLPTLREALNTWLAGRFSSPERRT